VWLHQRIPLSFRNGGIYGHGTRIILCILEKKGVASNVYRICEALSEHSYAIQYILACELKLRN